MNLQSRLTIWSIAIMALIVGFVSVLDLNDDLNTQFQATLARSDLIGRVVSVLISSVIERDPKAPVNVTINQQALGEELVILMGEQKALVEIAVCDPQNRILADTEEKRVGITFERLPSFSSVVRGGSWREKLGSLWRTGNYEVSQTWGRDGKPLLMVRMVVVSSLLRNEMKPAFKTHMEIALASIVGAMLAALLFSTFAFRPLGKVGKMLDLLAKGEYEEQFLPAEESNSDEVGVMASKVSLLGQQLRGAHYEFSDLKDNFERLLNELEDAVLIFGRDRRLIAAAGAVERFLTRPRGELLGLLLSDIFSPSTSLGLLLAQAVQTGRPIRNRGVPIKRGNGTGASNFIALLSVEILESSGAVGPGAGVLIRLRDPEATRQIGRQLQTADRLSAISRLTGGVAHEVKNPLNAMMMHVELARMKLAHGDYDVTPQMDVISGEIMRLDRVVKTFLDFTRPVVLNLVDVPLETMVNDIADLARPQAQAAGIEILVKQESEGVSITADVDLLKQAFLNIVVNAIEAMPNGGNLRIESYVRGDEAEIRIADTGPGISPEVREKIYNLYFTTKEHGSGIGLAMTFRIVQLHDGAIDLVSEAGMGTTFLLRFPIAVLQG